MGLNKALHSSGLAIRTVRSVTVGQAQVLSSLSVCLPLIFVFCFFLFCKKNIRATNLYLKEETLGRLNRYWDHTT